MNNDTIENMYKDAFSQVKPIATDAILGELVGRLTPKPSRFKRKTFVVLFAACFLLLSTAAVAAAQVIINRSGIERLAEIIGEDEAAELQHLGIANFPEDACITDLIPDDIYWVDSMVTDDGVRVELIAVGTGYDYIDIYLLLEDLTGNRFVYEEWLRVDHYIRFTDACSWTVQSWSHGQFIDYEIIGRDIDAGIVLLHSRLMRPRHHQDQTHINPRNLTFNITTIRHSFESFDYQEVDINLAALITEPFLLRSTQGCGARDMVFYGEYFNVSPGEVEHILQPHTLDFQFEAEGYPMYISALGVKNNRLHIQIYTPGIYGRTSIYLQRPCGEIIAYSGFIRFKLDEDGNYENTWAWEDGNTIWLGERHHTEYIFEVDTENLEGYRLLFSFSTVEIIGLNWVVSFELVGGKDGAVPSVPPQLMERPSPPSFSVLMRDPIIWDMLGEGEGGWGKRIHTTHYPYFEVTRYFIDAHGNEIHEDDFDTLPPLLERYLWYRFWELEFGEWE